MSRIARSVRAVLCCVKADLHGSWSMMCCYLGAAVLIFGLLALSYRLQAAADGMQGPAGFGDIVAYYFAGSKPFVFTHERFEFPIGWFVVMMLLAHMTLWYPFQDIRGFGVQVLSRCDTRWSWWVGKCVWVAFCALAFFAVACLVAEAVAILEGGAGGLVISPSFLAMAEVSYVLPEQAQQSLSAFLVGVPFVMTTCCVVQLFVSLLFGPTVGYIFTTAMLTLSVLVGSPLLLGDHLMFLRAVSPDGVIANGVDAAAALMSWMVVACVGGGVAFSRIDLMGGGVGSD